VPYVENTLYSTNKYSCVRSVHTHTHYISYFIEHNGDDESHDEHTPVEIIVLLKGGVIFKQYVPKKHEWFEIEKITTVWF